VQVSAFRETLDRCDLVAIVHGRESEARVDASSVHQNRTRSTLAVIATLFGASHAQILPKQIEQSRSGIDLNVVRLTINGQIAIN